MSTEAERFIDMNTQKLAENKYLCPLSGKKFKGPDFVRKHILNKHIEKVDAIKQEVHMYVCMCIQYFRNSVYEQSCIKLDIHTYMYVHQCFPKD